MNFRACEFVEDQALESRTLNFIEDWMKRRSPIEHLALECQTLKLHWELDKMVGEEYLLLPALSMKFMNPNP